MKFTIRSETHEIESESWTLLRSKAPTNWIVREVSERDYGVDFYVEMANTNREITGEIFAGQLKGTRHLKWKADGTAPFPIKRSTVMGRLFQGPSQ